jgi:hypothetical protein
MPARASAVSDEVAERKRVKCIMKSGTGTRKDRSSLHKHPRRSSRPILSKGPKAARLQTASDTKVLAETRQQIKAQAGRIKLLSKLLQRQTSAGKVGEAAETQGQIDAISAELRILEMDVVAMSSGAGADAPVDDAAEDVAE